MNLRCFVQWDCQKISLFVMIVSQWPSLAFLSLRFLNVNYLLPFLFVFFVFWLYKYLGTFSIFFWSETWPQYGNRLVQLFIYCIVIFLIHLTSPSLNFLADHLSRKKAKFNKPEAITLQRDIFFSFGWINTSLRLRKSRPPLIECGPSPLF